MKRIITLFSTAILMFFAALPLRADVIHLKDGTDLFGEIIEETKTHYRLKVKYGETLISKDEVESVEWDKDIVGNEEPEAEDPNVDPNETAEAKIKRLLAANGGTEETENAVEAALDWLARHQDPKTGGWFPHKGQKFCKGIKCKVIQKTAPAETFNIAVTSMAVMAYLGHGETHKSGKHKDTVNKAIQWLLKQQDAKSGRFGPVEGESWIYNHAMASIAICDAYKLTGDEKLKKPAENAIKFILAAQNTMSGWKYKPKSGKSDTSVTSWMVQALKAGHRAKITLPRRAFAGALRWYDSMTRSSDGSVGYMKKGDNGSLLAGRPPGTYKRLPSMTAAAVYCKRLCGRNCKDAMTKKSISFIADFPPNYNSPINTEINYIYWFYGTHALARFKDENWKKWNKALQKALVDNQKKGPGCHRGSWEPVGMWSVVGGRIFATAINTLTLEVYYREKVLRGKYSTPPTRPPK